MRRRLLFLTLLLLAPPAYADDPPDFHLTFLGDRFEPAELAVPAGVKFVLRVENKSAAALEFESTTLHREKIVPAGATTAIFIGPVKAGSYEYFDDFHPKIRGQLVAH